jgi:hypothetical protein
MALAFLAVTALAVTTVGTAQANPLFGPAQKLGNGTVKSYAFVRDDGSPTAIGIVFKASALQGLPTEANRTSRCFDLDKNGRINDHGECEGDYELRLALPDALAARQDVPFRWIAVNWNPHGHPPKAWSVPHFDFHFYMAEQSTIDAIRVGPCPIFINCDDQKRALTKVPAKYVHPDHISVKATVGRMGDHLIDIKTPEMAPNNPKPFTHTWIFGAYDGHITFYEPMITREYLLARPTGCHRIKQPKAWEQAGYYPTMYCIRHSDQHRSYTVSLEGMVMRQAN